MKKIMMAFGTRPEAIKMAPLYHELKCLSDIFDVTVCVTAQHRHMLDQVLRTFEISPEYDLDLMTAGQDLFDLTSKILVDMRDVLYTERPDLILVHGDTTTTLGVSLAAFYANIPLGHVEAGLRTFDIKSPYPEEFNRQVTSKLATLHFVPSATEKINLLEERVSESQIYITGNTVIDALYWVLNRIESNFEFKKKILDLLGVYLPFSIEKTKYVLITGHRRENFGDGFSRICEAIRKLAFLNPGVEFVYPVHLNPNVQLPVIDILSNVDNIHLIPPLDYEPFSFLLKNCFFVLTDSGGIQEEAPSLAKPVLLMRDATERPDAVVAGTVKLVGTNVDVIVDNGLSLLRDEVAYKKMATSLNPYGHGDASKKIVEILKGI